MLPLLNTYTCCMVYPYFIVGGTLGQRHASSLIESMDSLLFHTCIYMYPLFSVLQIQTLIYTCTCTYHVRWQADRLGNATTDFE